MQIERSELIEKIKALRNDNRQIRSIVDEKFKDLQPLRQALGEIRSADTASRSGGLCSSEEELNSRVCFFSKLCASPNLSFSFPIFSCCYGFLAFHPLHAVGTDPRVAVLYAT